MMEDEEETEKKEVELQEERWTNELLEDPRTRRYQRALESRI